ncbi:hypothetical protein RZN22_10095 [Bacillaceae bacterium S4-13-58]
MNFIFVILGIIGYVLTAFAVMKMAQNENIDYAWLAWIPIGNMWVLGELITEKLKGNGGMKLLIISVISIFVSMIPFLGSIIVAIVGIVVIYWLLEKYSENAVLHTVLSVLIPIYCAIILFIHRDRPARY